MFHQFLYRCGLFVLLNMVIFSLFIIAGTIIDKFRHFEPGTRSNHVSAMLKGTDYHLVTMGTSHGKFFDHSLIDFPNKTESIKYLNLSQGLGAGLLPMKTYLQFFYSNGNSADRIVYLLDPWVFFTSQWNEKNQFTTFEPLNARLLKRLIQNDFDSSVVVKYFKANIEPTRFIKSTKYVENNHKLDGIDYEAVKKRIDNLYPDGTNPDNLKKYKIIFEEIIDLAELNDSKLIIVIPPTLLGDLPGHKEILQILAEQKKSHNIEYYDFSNKMLDPSFYRDHDHLNELGAKYFLDNYLKDLILN